MQTIQLRTRVGSDGVLKLEIPLKAREADLDVVVVVQPSAESLGRSRAAQNLSWEETYRQMAAENEDWSDWHSVRDEHGL